MGRFYGQLPEHSRHVAGQLSPRANSCALIYLRASRRVLSQGAYGHFEFGSYDWKERLTSIPPRLCPLPLNPGLVWGWLRQGPFYYLLCVKLFPLSVCPLALMAEATLCRSSQLSLLMVESLSSSTCGHRDLSIAHGSPRHPFQSHTP